MEGRESTEQEFRKLHVQQRRRHACQCTLQVLLAEQENLVLGCWQIQGWFEVHGKKQEATMGRGGRLQKLSPDNSAAGGGRCGGGLGGHGDVGLGAGGMHVVGLDREALEGTGVVQLGARREGHGEGARREGAGVEEQVVGGGRRVLVALGLGTQSAAAAVLLGPPGLMCR